MSRTPNNSVLSTLALALLVSCGGPTTQVIVSVDTDLAVPSELDAVRFVAMRGDRAPVERTATLMGGDLPVELGLVHDDGPLGPVDVTISGMRGSTVVVERRLRFDFVRGRVLVVRVELSRACVGVACEGDRTCVAGVCRDVRPRPDELLPWGDDAGTGCSAEACNGVDDDCDGRIDEGFDTSTDPEHCGACGRRCVAGPSSTSAACVAGRCELECVGSSGDCDGDPTNGCETPLDSTDNCGRCDRDCTRFEAESTCNAGRCEILACRGGQRDCDANPDNGCESNLDETENCGGCGIRCDLFHAVESCGTGTCTLTSCDAGWDNCDARSENGCEADVDADVFHCGGCSRRCEADAPNSADVCRDGSCGAECHPGWADCDGIADNGCETNLSLPTSCGGCDVRCSGLTFLCSGTTATGWSCIPPPCMDPPTRCGASCVDTEQDARHCGGCDVVCPGGPNAAPLCISAGCRLQCDPGYGDCDGDPSNGCEMALDDPANCGACGRECSLPGAVEACIGGSCLVVGCEPGFEDCNGLAIDGCERDLRTVTDCGACGVPCSRAHASAACPAGACVIGSCAPGWGDCDGVDANGCETALGPCDSCAGTCVLPNASGECRDDACAIAACGLGFGDCDGMVDNGCEVALNSLDDCGGCGVACVLDHATSTCATGACAVLACDAGYADCDGDPTNGCEADLEDDATCGSCDVRCTSSDVCAVGACRGEWDLVEIDAGDRHSCGITATGRGFCWGAGRDGRLGQGAWADSLDPVQVLGLNNALTISAGGVASCAVRTGGVVTCWGSNFFGQLAEPTLGENQPRNISIHDAIDVVVGGAHACALRASGRVACWGSNSRGQVGTGSTSAFPVGISDPGLSDVVQIDVGWEHTCAVTRGGDAYCWGANDQGQLGDGTTTMRTSPNRVLGLAGVQSITTGATSSAAVADGVVYTWGDNSEGQLGDGTTLGRLEPAPIVLGLATQVHMGRAHACAVLRSSAVWCWGDNSEGQLGLGTTVDSPIPGVVPGIAGGVLDVGVDHACHVDASDVWCWGRNDSGQLGNATTISVGAPVSVEPPGA